MRINKEHIGILSIVTTILLSACSSEDSGVQTVTTGNTPVGNEMQVMAYYSPFANTELTDVTDPAGFYLYTPDKTTNMGIYMLLPEDWTSPQEERIIYTNRWHAYFDVTADKNYTIYGYMPKTGDMSSTLTKSTADAATLTISNINPVTSDDICIITGVKDTNEGLKEGQFSWYTPVGVENYSIYMLMDHLYAAAQFRLRIDESYAQLRTIKLKTMTLRTNISSVEATVALTHNTTGVSPISSITYTASGNNGAVEIFNDEAGTPLDITTPLVINACYAPTLSGSLTLVSTYDVYDSKDNLIRQNCTSINQLPDLDAVRGQRVQVNMLVNPTYIYVLSEPDLDNPTIKIE